jgi:diguanylate cyclase
MNLIRAITKPKKGDPRMRIFLWAAFISLIVGSIELSDPLEIAMRMGRNLIRQHDADGSIVVAGMDDKSADQLGGYPWSRSQDAELIDQAFALGAKRIFFDKVFADPGDPEGDAALIDSLKRHKGLVFFSVSSTRSQANEQAETLFPNSLFRPHVGMVSLNAETGFAGYAIRIERLQKNSVGSFPSLSSELAGNAVSDKQALRPDYSIQASSIPTISVTDFIHDKVQRGEIANKDIVVGATSKIMHDNHWIPSQGNRPGVYTHVIAAQTLREGNPIDLGWLPAYLIAACAAVAHLRIRNRLSRNSTFWGGLGVLSLLPLFLDYFSISADSAAGLFLLTIVGVRYALFTRAHRNLVSDLPNLAAFRAQPVLAFETIVVLRVHNYSEIIASFERDAEQAMVVQIVRRLRTTDKLLSIFQGDEGSFLFTTRMSMSDELRENLEGHHKILTAPLVIEGRHLDLQFGFGVDSSFGTNRSVTTRINSAVVVAVETAARGDKWKEYEVERSGGAAWKLALLGDLDQAVADGSLRAAFQPKVDLRTGQIVGFEALARWTHPSRGVISPEIFIQAAEDSNRIASLTQHMLSETIECAARLRKFGMPHSLAVNLSSSLLNDATLPRTINRILGENDFPAGMLTLELTESGRAIGGTDNFEALANLRALGVKLSIDDYGTGNATMDYVRTIPSDELKIDKSFIIPMLQSDDNIKLVQAMIDMAHNLGRSVVAEGIETAEIAESLRDMGCDVGQGFGLHRPMPFLELVKILRKARLRKAA